MINKAIDLFWHNDSKAHSPFTEYEIRKNVETGKYLVKYWNYNEVTPTHEKAVEPPQTATGFISLYGAKNWAQNHFEEKLQNWFKAPTERELLTTSIQSLVDACHSRAAANGWWTDLSTGEPLTRNKGEMMMLIVSEIAEAMEGHRKGLKDDHLPAYGMEDVEFADALIRIFDYAGGHNLKLANAFVDKLDYNDNRVDHKIENRKKDGGKKY